MVSQSLQKLLCSYFTKEQTKSQEVGGEWTGDNRQALNQVHQLWLPKTLGGWWTRKLLAFTSWSHWLCQSSKQDDLNSTLILCYNNHLRETCDSLSFPVPTRGNCLMYLFSLRSGGPYQGRWQGQWFSFIWAAASVLILNTGGERDSQQEAGRTRRWHEQLGRLMVSLSPFPQCVSLGAEMEEPLCWGQ